MAISDAESYESNAIVERLSSNRSKRRRILDRLLGRDKVDQMIKYQIENRVLDTSSSSSLFTQTEAESFLDKDDTIIKDEPIDEITRILTAPLGSELLDAQRFRNEYKIREFCECETRDQCIPSCRKVHFKRLINANTDLSLGHCSFLNTCFHTESCKYVHYEIEENDANRGMLVPAIKSKNPAIPPQWIQCDIRKFDLSVLGKFSVIMADPPWDIHMELPYGTMADDEMRTLNIPALQDNGYIFLWVTGRAMELGRDCLKIWGYRRCDELVWVKTNQLQRIIRTGRTGHWLNHGKEHCLVGVKGDVEDKSKFTRGVDCDVIVSEVRATSRKPDEIYGIIERLSPGTQKIELFGRPHNIQPNWITLGNQLDGIHLVVPEVIRSFKRKYEDIGVLTEAINSATNQQNDGDEKVDE